MSEILPSFILGYHGCDSSVAEAVFAGADVLQPSSNDYDWLGDGIYFWEHNAQRAYDFAAELKRYPKRARGTIKAPAVIGAIINPGFCLNLLDARHIQTVRVAYGDLVKLFAIAEKELPRNEGGPDLLKRHLDCAVIRMLHTTHETTDEPPFDTVRAAFIEGGPLYEGAGFAAKNHIQVCVRDHRSIIGYFRPLDADGRPLAFSKPPSPPVK